MLFTEACFEPVSTVHLPGIANVVADRLSRRFDPAYAATWVVPEVFAGIPETKLPTRDDSWYTTLRR